MDRWLDSEKIEREINNQVATETKKLLDSAKRPDPYEVMVKPEKKKAACDFNTTWSCTGVDNSPYSEMFGLGMGIYGLVGYFLMLFFSVLHLFHRSPKSNFSSLLIFFGAFIGIFFSGYLTWIEITKLHQYCPYCVASATIMLLIFIFTLAGFGFEPLLMLIRKEVFPTSLLARGGNGKA